MKSVRNLAKNKIFWQRVKPIRCKFKNKKAVLEASKYLDKSAKKTLPNPPLSRTSFSSSRITNSSISFHYSLITSRYCRVSKLWRKPHWYFERILLQIYPVYSNLLPIREFFQELTTNWPIVAILPNFNYRYLISLYIANKHHFLILMMTILLMIVMNCFLEMVDWQQLVKSYFQLIKFSEILAIANLRHTANKMQASKFHGNNRFGSVEVPWASILWNKFMILISIFVVKCFVCFKIKKKKQSLLLCLLRIFTGKKHRRIKFQRLVKVRIWVFGLLVH